MKKRIICILLVVSIIFGLLHWSNTPVMAAENIYGVLKIDRNVYETNQDNTDTTGEKIDKEIVTHLFVADDVTTIGDMEFESCPELRTVDMPSVTSIGYSAFLYCSNLTTVNMPSVTNISDSAFAETILTTLTVPAKPPVTTNYPFSNQNPITLNIVGGNTVDNLKVYKEADDGNTTDNKWFGWPLILLDVIADKNDLVSDAIKGLNSDLSNIMVALKNPLPLAGTYGSEITWESSNLEVLSHDGQTIVIPTFIAGNATVTLTATIKKEDVTQTKEFTLIVLADKRDGPAAPLGITKTNETGIGLNDGKLDGVSIGQEYQLNGTGLWTEIFESQVTNLAPGRYTVRVKETTTHKAGVTTEGLVIAEATGDLYGVLSTSGKIYVTNEDNTIATTTEISDTKKINHLYVANGVTTIVKNAFEECTALKTVEILGETSIGEKAFSLCSALIIVKMQEVKSIGKSSFSN